MDDIEGLKTPIYCIVYDTRPLDMKSLFDSDHWAVCFPEKSFTLQNKDEVD